MEIRLDGKRSLVTGGNSGIGEAIAVALAGSGARVAVNYVANPEAAGSVVERIGKEGSEGLAIEADVSDPDAVSRMFAQLDRAWGGIDILINNAGIDGKRARAWEADPAAWRRVVEINLFGAFYCAREALRRMVAQKRGVVLNIASVHEIIPWSGYSAYTASKAALGMLTKTLAQEAAPAGVRVLAVGPGAIKTHINAAVWGNPAGLKDLLQKIPMGRLGETEDIARMVTVLVSDVAGYVTGHTVFIDGGMTDYPLFSHGG